MLERIRDIVETKELQRQIVVFAQRWEKKRKTAPSEEANFIHLVEEVGELAKEYVNKHSRPTKYSEAEVENAIVDILVHTIYLAHMRDIDIETAILQVMKDEEKLLQD